MNPPRPLRTSWLFVITLMLAAGTWALLPPRIAHAALCRSQAGGSWYTVGTWDCGHIPTTSADDVQIYHAITIPSGNVTGVRHLSIDSGGTLDAQSELDIYGDLNSYGPITASSSLVFMGGGSHSFYTFDPLSISATIDVAAGNTLNTTGSDITCSSVHVHGTWNAGSGALTVTNSFWVDTSGTFLGDAPLTVQSFTNQNAFTAPGSVVFTGSSAIGGSTNTTFDNLTIDPGASLSVSNIDLTINGSWTNNGSGLISPGGQTVTFGGSGSHTLSGSNTFHDLIINKTSGGSIVLTGNQTIQNNLLVQAGTLDLGTSTANGGSGGTLQLDSGTTLSIGASMASPNTLPGGYATYALNSGSTVLYAGGPGVTQAISSTPTYGTLMISGAGTKVAGGNLTIAGDLTIGAGTLDLGGYTANRSSSGGTLSVGDGASLQIGGTQTLPGNYSSHSLAGGSTVEYSGSNQPISAEAYGLLITSGSGTKTLGEETTVAGSLTIGSGTTLATGGYDLGVAGDWTNSGAFTNGGGTVTFTGSAPQTVVGNPTTFYNLIINKAGASDAVTVSNSLGVARLLTITSGRLVSASDYHNVEIKDDGTLELTNDITVSGNFTKTTGGTFTPNSHKTTFDGATAQNVNLGSSTDFYNLVVVTDTTLIETNSSDNFFVGHQLTNYGRIRKTQAVAGVGPYSFGLAGRYAGAAVAITATTPGGLTAIQLDRIDANHATPPSGRSSDIYWNITPTGDSYTVTLTLPHDGVTSPVACRQVSGTTWNCAYTSRDSTTVTRVGVTTFSDWAVYQGPPTAVRVREFRAISRQPLAVSR